MYGIPCISHVSRLWHWLSICRKKRQIDTKSRYWSLSGTITNLSWVNVAHCSQPSIMWMVSMRINAMLDSQHWSLLLTYWTFKDNSGQRLESGRSRCSTHIDPLSPRSCPSYVHDGSSSSDEGWQKSVGLGIWSFDYSGPIPWRIYSGGHYHVI